MPVWLLPFLKQLLVGLVLQMIGYALMPKPKASKPDEVKDLESPTTEAGIPIPVIFGDITINSVNYIGVANKETIIKEVTG